MVWVYDETWCVVVCLCARPTGADGVALVTAFSRPELLHPFASAIDAPPLEAPEHMVRPPGVCRSERCRSADRVDPSPPQVIVKTDSKPDYVRLPDGPKHVYEHYGPDSIEEWHKKHGKYVP